MDFEILKNAMADIDEDKIIEIMQAVIAAGGSDALKAMEACQAGMEIVGNRFDAGEYFVSDLIYAGEVLSDAMKILTPALKSGDSVTLGKMILCTVKDDLHDIGKNIVRSLLEASGFDVLDLGIDVPASEIIKVANEQNIKIIALSGVLTNALESMQKAVAEIVSAGIRDKVKIIVGGSPVTEEACGMIGADEWALSPQKTVNVCKGWASEK